MSAGVIPRQFIPVVDSDGFSGTCRNTLVEVEVPGISAAFMSLSDVLCGLRLTERSRTLRLANGRSDIKNIRAAPRESKALDAVD